MSAMSLSRGVMSLAPSASTARRGVRVVRCSGAGVVRCSSVHNNRQQQRAELGASPQQQQQRAGAVAAVAGAASTAWMVPHASAHDVGAAMPIAEVAEDIFNSTGLGPALCVVFTIYIGWVVWTGTQTIKRLKAGPGPHTVSFLQPNFSFTRSPSSRLYEVEHLQWDTFSWFWDNR